MAKTAAAPLSSVAKLRESVMAEAKRRGITESDVLRELDVPKLAVHARVPHWLVKDIDDEAKRREMTRSEVIADRLERAGKQQPKAA